MTTDTWVVTLTYDVDPDMETMDSWEDQLEDLDGVVARIPGRGVDITVHAPDHLTMDEALFKVRDRAASVVQHNEPVGIEIITAFEHERRAESATLPELMSAAEIAEELGVSRQRVHQLRDTAAFPAPLADLRGGAVWDAAAIRKFNQEWERKPGRPRADDPWSWFHEVLDLNERVTVLDDPYRELPHSLVEQLMKRPGIVSPERWGNDPLRWPLSGPASRRLATAKAQLEHWWEHLTDESRDYLIEHRNGQLAGEYADLVYEASANPRSESDALVVVLLRDVKNRFSLPPVVQAFVELKARQDVSS